jgi:AbrB family looped-hinge helix DNA binding protein
MRPEHVTLVKYPKQIGHLGRLVIPGEIRELLNLQFGTPVHVYVEGERVCIERVNPENYTGVAQVLHDLQTGAISHAEAEALINKIANP